MADLLRVKNLHRAPVRPHSAGGEGVTAEIPFGAHSFRSGVELSNCFYTKSILIFLPFVGSKSISESDAHVVPLVEIFSSDGVQSGWSGKE